MNTLHYGFIDESGIVDKKAGSGRFFIVSVILVANPAEIKNVMKIARRKAKNKFKTHTIYHSYKESEGFIKLVLTELAKRDIGIVVGVWDKRKNISGIIRNERYARIISKLVGITLQLYPQLHLIIHRRYTNPQDQALLHGKSFERVVTFPIQPYPLDNLLNDREKN